MSAWQAAVERARDLPVAAEAGRIRAALAEGTRHRASRAPSAESDVPTDESTESGRAPSRAPHDRGKDGRSPCLLVQAPPGTGKTTLVPLLLAETCAGRIVVTQPRRVAARAAAKRIARLLGEDLGETVGHTVRGESSAGRRTRIEMVTPGVLVRRLQADPELAGVGALVLDEVHERSLESDLALAFAADVRAGLREDLALVAMSATPERGIAEFLGAAVVDVPGAIHPVDVRWAPPRGAQPLGARGVSHEFLEHVASTVRRALHETADGDLLVFLPGVREIDGVAAALDGIDVQRLHGRLPSATQDRVLSPAPRPGRRVVLATSVAESSLTVPGVRVVVDAGLSREQRVDHGRGAGALVTVRESRASGVQRAGRAGREGPGVVYRCMDEPTWARLAPQPEPEIRTADLAGFALETACWGSAALLEDPPRAGLDAARRTLRDLGCLDDAGAATDLGRRVAALPLRPRLGRALLEAAARIGTRAAARACALVEEDVRVDGADLAGGWRGAHDPTLSRMARRLERLASQARGYADPALDGTVDPTSDGTAAGRRPVGVQGIRDEAIALVVGLAYPERIARRRSAGSRRYLLANGLGAELPERSPLVGQEWLAIADLQLADRADATIRAAVPIGELDVADHLREIRHEVHCVGGRLRGRRIEALGAIELSQTAEPPRADAALAWAGSNLAFEWSEGAKRLRERLAFLHDAVGEPWPDVSDAALAQRRDEWAGPEVAAFLRGEALKPVAAEQMSRILPWPEAARLSDLAPERIDLPLGPTPVDYSDGSPVVRVRVQEVFGLVRTPRAAGIPVTFELLSPARRPVAITDDLAGFWEGAYAQVRAEMRGRYPKHPWPENPAEAEPTRRAKPR